MKELEKNKLTKEEFIYWANWISMRWSNIKADSNTIRSLYNDFSIYNDNILGQAAIEQLDEGGEFFSWPKLKRRCKEIYNGHLIDAVNDARTKQEKELLIKNQGSGLTDYLKSQGWKNIEEAIFYTTKKLYNNGRLYKPGVKAFSKYKDLTYLEAKNKGWKLGLMDNIL